MFKLNKPKRDISYEAFMVLLAVLAVGTIWYDTGVNDLIIWITWAIFVVDFVYRFFTSPSKWAFIKSNPFLLIAIVPLDALFQMARLARILHLLRLKTITKYYTMPFIRFLKRQSYFIVAAITFLMLFISVIPLYYLEPEIQSYIDAFFSSIISLLFFGRTDFEPATTAGKSILVTLSIFGVVLYGLIISITIDVFLNLSWTKRLKAAWKRKSRQRSN
ncbi:hypothetical protein [Alteribacillus sp. HJP-4]|uniref:hypothetical protein n=1 Tax=Alteribacillus sp. HJP-4 TaxID=2775394 RepID=UPI0035CD2D82